jgi:hypothetical protein
LEKKKALRLSIKVLMIVIVVVFVVGFYNLFVFISGIASWGSFGPKLTKDESTGDWTLTFTGNPKNGGFLGMSLSLELTISDVNQKVIAMNSTTIQIGAGSSQPVSLTMKIPAEFVPGGNLTQAKGYFEMKMDIRTLGNLMGLAQVIKVGGGGP